MNELVKKVTTSVTNATGRTMLKAQKNAPELLMGLGVIGFVGTVILACKATLKADEVIQRHQDRMDRIHEAEEAAINDDEIDYDPEVAKQDKAISCVKMAGDFAKLYAPSVAVGGLSLACILYSEKILKNRYLTAVSAFNAITAAYETYRSRVRAEMGDEFDRHILTGSTYTTVEKEVIDEKGKKKKVEEKVEVIDPNETKGEYVRWFDEKNKEWDQNVEYSLMFLRAQQKIATDILNSRGHIFLNEVFDMLGFEHSQVGAMVGWVKGLGDDFVDFGLYDPNNESAKRFINGYSNSVMLEFNVDGIIWDKI